MKIYRLVKSSFDNSENRDAYHEKVLGTFMDGGELTAHGKITQFLREMAPECMYLGWDGKIYPQFRIDEEIVK